MSSLSGTRWFQPSPNFHFHPSPSNRAFQVQLRRPRRLDGTWSSPRLGVAFAWGKRRLRLIAKLAAGLPGLMLSEAVAREHKVPLGAVTSVTFNGRAYRVRHISLPICIPAIDGTCAIWTVPVLIWNRPETIMGKTGFLEHFTHELRRGDILELRALPTFPGVIGGWSPSPPGPFHPGR